MSDLTLVYLGYCIIRGGKICVNIAMSAYYIQHFYCQNLDFKDSFSSYHYIIDASFHSSEKTGLRSTFWPRETLQNLLCLCKKKTPVVFFIFHFEQLWALALSMPWSMWPKTFFQPYFAVLWEIFPTVYLLLFLFYTYLVNNNFKRIVIFLIMKSYS